MFLHPSKWNGRTIIWLSSAGKAGLYDPSGTPRDDVMKLVSAGNSVVGIDLFKQGEFLNQAEVVIENPHAGYSGKKAENKTDWRQSSVYLYGYNHSIFARRVHDLLTATTFVRNHETWKINDLAVVGLGDMGPIASAARAIAGGAIDRLFVETEGFRFANLDSPWHQHFIPGAAKYGDVAGFLALSAPHATWIADSDDKLQAALKMTWKTAGNEAALNFHKSDGTADEAIVAELLNATLNRDAP